ncbi:translation initiation factor [Candidatus Uabimicrobium amorphum]|uniref:Translation initiation factor n=1 Tax=Uabimicrobium amorphum TaxID=2596890 RepID=A0A5S9IKQ5_UABAM|nr:translation initiation factor [Candidatus Uabimicrobium amorphum]BBM82375.1 translation initiation factor [Candidatus Uabimicrobium amorphum]
MSKKVTKGQGWSLVSATTEETTKVTSLSPQQQKVKIFVEKRKKGKVVTVVDNIVLNDKDMKALSKKLKAACGVGGTVGKEHIELQGDCCEKVKAWLQKANWGVA